jgi:hypothetical protein
MDIKGKSMIVRNSQIIQFYIEIESAHRYEFLEELLHKLGYAYYLPPARDKLPKTLEEIECLLEDK